MSVRAVREKKKEPKKGPHNAVPTDYYQTRSIASRENEDEFNYGSRVPEMKSCMRMVRVQTRPRPATDLHQPSCFLFLLVE